MVSFRSVETRGGVKEISEAYQKYHRLSLSWFISFHSIALCPKIIRWPPWGQPSSQHWHERSGRSSFTIAKHCGGSFNCAFTVNVANPVDLPTIQPLPRSCIGYRPRWHHRVCPLHRPPLWGRPNPIFRGAVLSNTGPEEG